MAPGADVEIRFSLSPAPELKAERLTHDMFYPVAAPEWQGSETDLESAILFECSNLICNWEAWVEDAGLDLTLPPLSYAITYTVPLMATMAGAGLTMSHDTLAGHLLKKGQLIRPFDHMAPMQEAYYLISGPDVADVPGAQAFADWLRAEMAADQSGRDATQQ